MKMKKNQEVIANQKYGNVLNKLLFYLFTNSFKIIFMKEQICPNACVFISHRFTSPGALKWGEKMRIKHITDITWLSLSLEIGTRIFHPSSWRLITFSLSRSATTKTFNSDPIPEISSSYHLRGCSFLSHLSSQAKCIFDIRVQFSQGWNNPSDIIK